MQKVITHIGNQGRHVDLCEAHDSAGTVQKFTGGVDYQGVAHGLHNGHCAECCSVDRADDIDEVYDIEDDMPGYYD